MGVGNRVFGRSLLLVAAAGAALSCAAADPSASVGVLRSGISGGQPDATDANVFILVSHRGSTEVALCSASLIAPNLLLTARHCVSNVSQEQVTCGQTEASAPYAANTFYATNTENVDSAGNANSVFRGASVSVPPQGTDICGFDVALLTLDSLVPASVAVPLVPRIDRPVQAGELYSAVGYGQTSAGDAGVAGERRDRSGMKVDCAPGGCGVGVEANEFLGDTGICSGDSGGPALDSAGKVVGVVSRSADDCAHPVYGSVASWKDWIIGVAQQAATSGKYTPPFWVQTGLSDPPVTSPVDAGAVTTPTTATSGGTQGETCSAPQDCQTGYGCFSPSGSASNAYCALFCKAQSECASGTRCDTGVGVCVNETASVHTATSCALSVVGPSSRSGTASNVWLLGLAGLVLAGYKRRRAPFSKRAELI